MYDIVIGRVGIAVELPKSVLANFQILEHLSEDELNKVKPLFRTLYCSKGQFVFSSASQSNDVFFLVSGQVRVCFFSENGKLVHFEELQPGMMFGELAALDNQGRSSDCLSVEDCQLATLSAKNFKTLINEHSTVRDVVLTRLAQMVRVNMRKVYEFTTYSVPQRIRFELLRLASETAVSGDTITLEQVPTHAEIATRVSTHREAVTREIKRLEAQGIIVWTQSEHKVLDVVNLSERAISK